MHFRFTLALTSFCCFLQPAVARNPIPNANGRATAKENAEVTEKAKPIKLFNGKNLDGFYTYIKGQEKNADPDGVFSVTRDGLLRISGRSLGYLATKKSFQNYRLVAEFKWGQGDKSSDSGIFFHADGNDKLWMKSLEVQLRAGATGDLCLIGKGATLTSAGEKKVGGCLPRAGKGDPQAEVENARGQWNTIELTCHDATVRIKINGKTVVEGAKANPRSGRIYLQSYAGELFYRKVELHAR